MRALSVRPPWPLAIIHGKSPENRTWPTAYRGEVAIHASKAFDDVDMDTIEWIAEATDLTVKQIMSQPRGAVVAVTQLIGCHEHLDPGTSCDAGASPICTPWAAFDQWHWELTGPVALPTPVPCRGRLGLWRLPHNTEALVRSQLTGLERPS